MSTVDKVRVLIVGDSETGKTSFSKLIAHGKPCERPQSTIGCSTEVKLHEYKAGLPGERPYFIELWDIGGSRGHENARSIYYNPIDGLILLHDLSNRKSLLNLQAWLKEVHNYRDGGKLRQVVTDSEVYSDPQLPTLVVGNKVDILKGYEPAPSYLADDCDAEEIFMDSTSSRYLAAGSSNAVKLSKFFDKVIENKLSSSVASPVIQSRDTFLTSQERKRNYSPSRMFAPKSSHTD